MVILVCKIFASIDLVHPKDILTSVNVTGLAIFYWNFTTIMVCEILLGMMYAFAFEDGTGLELVVYTVMVMTLVAGGSIYSIQPHLSGFMGINTGTIWISMAVLEALCVIAVFGGRRGQASREGYSKV